jgi:hypothetical protein
LIGRRHGITFVTAMHLRAALIFVTLISCVLAVDAGAQPAAGFAKFSGEVSHGKDFERDFGAGLLFRLTASRNPQTPGWTIEVRRKFETSPEIEFSSVVTPPYRFWNPRYIDVSYGYSAAQAAAIDVREFSFLRNPADFGEASAALGKVLWPNGISKEEVSRSMALLDSVAKCTGILRILDHRIVAQRLDWLKFEVELCPGADQQGLLEMTAKKK